MFTFLDDDHCGRKLYISRTYAFLDAAAEDADQLFMGSPLPPVLFTNRRSNRSAAAFCLVLGLCLLGLVFRTACHTARTRTALHRRYSPVRHTHYIPSGKRENG